MKNKAVQKAIVSYYSLSLLLTIPLIIPIWLVTESLWRIVYFIGYLFYIRIAINYAVQVTVMSSLWKELDAEKYAQIINANPFRVHYSHKLNLYFASGDYQAAYNLISSVLLQHKNVQNRIYGYLLICRICFERGDYEGLKKSLEQIDHYFKYNARLKLPKPNKEAYEFYRAFSNANYEAVVSLLEKSIEKYSKNKNRRYSALMRQYQLAVTKRMSGEVDVAAAILEKIKEKTPKLYLSTLAQKQLDCISGTLEETIPEQLEVTETYSPKPYNKAQRVFKLIALMTLLVGLLLTILPEIMIHLDSPNQENKDPEYMAEIESVLYNDYKEYQLLGYICIYADDSETVPCDSVFLVESDGKIDLHTHYKQNETEDNHLNVSDIQVNQMYVYENLFSKKIAFVLTEKKRNIPDNVQFYYEIDGYYFCVIDISDIE